MIKKKIISLVLLVLLAVVSCTPSLTSTSVLPSPTTSLATVQPSATSQPSDTPFLPSPTLAPTSTPVPTDTAAPTITLIPSLTETPSLVPTKTILFNLPGLHQVNKCGRTSFHYSDSRALDFNGPYTLSVDLCVITVLVNSDYTMKFNLEWRLVSWDGPLPSRYMYASNDYMSLGDNQGNGYGKIGDSGIVVDDDTQGGKPDTYKCWYLFPPAREGATTFTLFDMVKKVSVSGIMLWPGK